jgi:type VI secretion system protein ImpL
MFILRGIWRFLTSRWLWTLIGVVCLALIVWMFGPLVGFGESHPLESEVARLAVIGGLVLIWLVWIILRQRRAMRANRLFVSELAVPEVKPLDPSAESVAAVSAKFQEVLDELKRRKLGGRRFLREMPWYVIIGPPAAGKTTALRQSGLDFPFDLTDDLQGVGGTRNCDWFFTEDAVLIDTAGRYVLQESAPEADAAEWLGFLDLLKKHRGRKALNGVIVAVPVDLLAEGDAAIRAHGREIRKRLAELDQRLEVRLPVYLLVTKADLIKGFELSFDDLSTADREQVWGATFAPGERPDGAAVARELGALAQRLEARVGARMEGEEELATRAEIFRFPAQAASLEAPLKTLVDTVFGESRYEASPWLRGFYLTSATQEGTPIDRLVGALASSFGLPAAPQYGTPRVERRSFFLRRLLTDVIFPEAGLATLDPKAEERRVWIWRGAAVGAAGLVVLATVGFLVAYLANRGAVAAQVAELDRLRAALGPVAARQAPLAPSDLDVALEAVTEVENARAPLPGVFARVVGPSAAPQVESAQSTAYGQALRNILEPRMVALLEATMWRNIRDPDFLLGALKTYRMMTGLSQMDPGFVADWWVNRLPEFSETPPFPTEAALAHQLAAIERMAVEESYIAPDEGLVGEALVGVCSIPLARRAYDALRSDPAATALPEWVPASFAGPNGAKVLTRRSGDTLRVGIDGIFTYAGFHDVVLARLEEVAGQAALDRSVFAGGCDESAQVSVDALAEDMLKLYYEDFIAQWDAFLRDIVLAPLDNLQVASENLKDLSSADSALKRLLTAVVAETDLARPKEPPAEGGGPPKGASKILGKLGKLGKLAKKGSKLIPTAGAAAPATLPGQPVSDHFKPIRAAVQEVDGAPPALDDAVIALTALSNVLQTVVVSPNPDQAIKEQGGLAELTGAVASQAAILPDPLDDWLAGIAGDTTDLTEEAVASQLNAIWRADVLPFCKAALAGRYPFDPGSPTDVNTADFARVFGPGGLIDSFTNDQLLTYVDTAARPWRWRADLGLDDAALASLERARRIRDGLFPGGAGPIMTFTLEPKDLSPSAARVTLNLDGQVLNYFNSATRPQPMTWPGKDGTGVITLSFQPVDGSPEVMVSETGSWALLRMLREARLQATELPELFRLRLAARGHYADFELRAGSVDNPFDLQMFASFTCPERI